MESSLFHISINPELDVNYPRLTETFRLHAQGTLEYISGNWLVIAEGPLDEWRARLAPCFEDPRSLLILPVDISAGLPLKTVDVTEEVSDFLTQWYPGALITAA